MSWPITARFDSILDSESGLISRNSKVDPRWNAVLGADVQLYEEIKNHKACEGEKSRQKIRKIDTLRQTDPWM